MALINGIYRIVDANFNRSREGLRVCEDVFRFIVNSPAITKELKTLRHGITSVIRSRPGMAMMLVESRDAKGDVGRIPKPKIEAARKASADIFIANIERVKESVRVLEEFFKVIDIKLSHRLSRIRFRTYEIEKRALKRLASLRYSG